MAKKKSAKKMSAKKAVRKPARRAPAKATKRTTAKKTPRKAPTKAKPAAKSRPTTGPQPVSTGSGPGPGEIGASLVEMFNSGKIKEIEARWWASDITSVEGMGMAYVGRKAVDAKNSDWYVAHILHGASAEGPFVGATGFAVRFKIDVEERASKKRMLMDEIGVYTVHNGKITREEFMYGSVTPSPAAG